MMLSGGLVKNRRQVSSLPSFESGGAGCWRRHLEYAEAGLGLLFLVVLPVSPVAAFTVFVIGLPIWTVLALSARLEAEKSILQAPITLPSCVLAGVVALSGAFNSTAWHGHLGPNWAESLKTSLLLLRTCLPGFWIHRIFHRHGSLVLPGVVLLLSVSSICGYSALLQSLWPNLFGWLSWVNGSSQVDGSAFSARMLMFSMLALGMLVSKATELLPDQRLAILCSRPVFIGIAAGNFAGVLVSGTEAAWVGILCGVLTVVAVMSWRSLIFSLILLLSCAALSFHFLPTVKSRVQHIVSGRDSLVVEREKAFKSCSLLFSKSPLFGAGLNRFPELDLADSTATLASRPRLTPGHSNPCHIMALLGGAGLFACGLLLAMVVRECLLELQSARLQANLVRMGVILGLLAGVAAVAGAGLLEFNFGSAEMRLAQFSLLGLL